MKKSPCKYIGRLADVLERVYLPQLRNDVKGTSDLHPICRLWFQSRRHSKLALYCKLGCTSSVAALRVGRMSAELDRAHKRISYLEAQVLALMADNKRVRGSAHRVGERGKRQIAC